MANETTTRVAVQVPCKRKGYAGDARLYRLTPPMPVMEYDYDQRESVAVGTTEYVIVSAVVAMYTGPETYIFAANADGEVTDWGEMEGSFRGALDHEAALARAGYRVEVDRG